MKQSLALANPAITGYHHRAMPLSILSAQPSSLSWVLNNFIQLCCSQSFDDPQYVFDFTDLNMLYLPTFWLDRQFVDYSILDQSSHILKSFIIDCITNKYYVHLFLDEYFIPYRSPFNKKHVLHDILVFGYDNETNSFDVAGFDELGRYRQTQVTYQQFQQATSWLQEPTIPRKPLLLLKPHQDKRYDFNIAHLSNLLTSFLCSEKPSGAYNNASHIPNSVYGLKVYQALQRYIQYGLDHQFELEARPLQMLVEHKQLMQQRLNYLQLHNHLRDAQPFLLIYAELEKSSLAMRNNLLKYHITQEERYLLKIQEQLASIKIKERKILSLIIEALR